MEKTQKTPAQKMAAKIATYKCNIKKETVGTPRYETMQAKIDAWSQELAGLKQEAPVATPAATVETPAVLETEPEVPAEKAEELFA
jgi:hypothetical protein